MIGGESLPVVRIWHPDGNEWVQVGVLGTYEGLTFKSVAYDLGSFSVSAEYVGQAFNLTQGSLLTIDWRGKRTTWWGDSYKFSNSDGKVTVDVTGKSALALLARADVWIDPTVGIKNQPDLKADDPAPYRGPAETVVKQIVTGNYVNRLGFALRVPATQDLGSSVRVRPKFDNLLEMVLTKARAGGILVDVGLVNVGAETSTRARLTLQVRTRTNRSNEVRLSTRLGTVASWEQTTTAPTLTKAIVVDKDGAGVKVREVVTTPESEAVAAAWGGHWTARVVGPGSKDAEELQEAGKEAILNGIGGKSLSITAAEAVGMRAFVHYDVGDIGTAELVEGDALVDTITSIEVAVGSDGVSVTPTFGNPDASQPFARLASFLRQIRRNVKHLERD